MDEMQPYELHLLKENIGWTYKQEWDIARINAYCSLSSFGKPKKSYDKFMPMPFDKDNTYDIGKINGVMDEIFVEDELEKIQKNKNMILERINGKIKNRDNI